MEKIKKSFEEFIIRKNKTEKMFGVNSSFITSFYNKILKKNCWQVCKRKKSDSYKELNRKKNMNKKYFKNRRSKSVRQKMYILR